MTNTKGQSVSRRKFIATAGKALAVASALPGCAGRTPRVAVVGAGLSGLTAALELRDAGLDVTVFEASDRAGGRAFTIRDYFDDGRHVDAGAMGADRSYTQWMAYCDRFGVEVVDREPPPPERESLLFLEKRLRSAKQLQETPTDWPIDLADSEKPLAPSRLLFSHLREVASEIGAVENVLDPAWARYDDLSLADFLIERRASPAAIALIERSLNYNSLGTVSTLSALRDTARRLQGPPAPVEPVAGHGSLPEAMAAALRDELRFRTPLVAVRHSADGVTLTLDGAGGHAEFDADYLVVTLPFTALRRVSFTPGLPEARQRMIENLPYTRIAKTFVQSRTQFWKAGESAQDFSILTSDTRFERVFNLSEPDAGGMLLNWINGVGLDEFSGIGADAHAERVREWLTEVWPEARGKLGKSLTVNWAESYAGGAYAHYAPGQLREYAPEIPRPIGRLHFAGEHTELVAPGLEGAVVSGMRAANEVVERLS